MEARAIFATADIVVYDNNVPADQLPVPDDYVRADDNPYVFVRKLPDCKHRSKSPVQTTCCGKVSLLFCTKQQTKTTREICQECELVEQ